MEGRVENQNQPQTMRLEKDEGNLLVPGQRFIVFSYIGPAKCKGEDGQPKEFHSVKFRGAFATQEEADKHMHHLAKNDPYYDVFMADAGAWLVLPPPRKMENTTYHEQHLNDIFSKYKEDAIRAKKEFETRQQTMIEEAERKNQELRNEAKKLLEEDLPEATDAPATDAPATDAPATDTKGKGKAE
jgi:hypothetical protein